MILVPVAAGRSTNTVMEKNHNGKSIKVYKAIEKHKLSSFPILLSHIYYTQTLSYRHRDPYDRLLIAQSITENISIISSMKYSIRII
jgi:PIN domain nuclease of toxin-antitoxin system